MREEVVIFLTGHHNEPSETPSGGKIFGQAGIDGPLTGHARILLLLQRNPPSDQTKAFGTVKFVQETTPVLVVEEQRRVVMRSSPYRVH